MSTTYFLLADSLGRHGRFPATQYFLVHEALARGGTVDAVRGHRGPCL